MLDTDLDAVRGDTNEWDVTCTRDGAAIDTSAWSALKFTVKRSIDDPDTALVLQKTLGAGITLQAPANAGKALLKLDPADTASLPARSFLYDLELTETSGRVTTVAKGRLRLDADVEQS